MHNDGLLNAILALSIHYLSLTPNHVSNLTPEQGDDVQYYQNAVLCMKAAMKQESYRSSDDLPATWLIICAYQMMGGSQKDREKHLQGSFLLQSTQLIHGESHGESHGIKKAAYWAWLSQDLWAAFQEKRELYTRWTPTKDYSNMTSYEIAARSVHLTARVVSYCSQTEIHQGKHNFKSRVAKADHLASLLDEWQRHLRIKFSSLPISSKAGSVFKPIWVHPPAFSKSSNCK